MRRSEVFGANKQKWGRETHSLLTKKIEKKTRTDTTQKHFGIEVQPNSSDFILSVCFNEF